MKRSTLTLSLISATNIFILACVTTSLPSLATQTPQTIITVPPMSTFELPEQPNSTLENENLLTTIPSSFKVDFSDKQNNFVITEMVQEGESVNDWSTMITVEIFLGEKNTTPQQYQETLTERWFNACENSETYPLADGVENSYNFVLWQLYCPLNAATQKEEYTFLKAIQGNDSFYLVQVAFRHEPSDDEITQWMRYLKEIQVCDSRIAEQACP
jgi:hypothetical protein